MPSWFPIKRLPALPPRRMVRFAGSACLGLLLVLIVSLAIPALFTLFGFRAYVIYGGSMGSALPVGSVGITETVDSESIKVGDIVAIKKAGRALPVLHRITDMESDAGTTVYTTQGDSNGSPDPDPVTLNGSGDRVVFVIPYLGYLVHFARGTMGRVFLLLIPSLLLLGFSLWQVWLPKAQRLYAGEEPEC
jgi:signal peptidase